MKTLFTPSPIPRPSRLPAKAAATLPAFDPDLPEDGALIIAEVLRDQFNALNDDIQTRATQAALDGAVASLNTALAQCATYPWVVNTVNTASDSTVATVLPQTSANSNGVAVFDQSVPSYYDTYFQQGMVDKINELINALRR